jgi:hypothetical protein
MKYPITLPIVVLMLAALACDANITLPTVSTAGPEITEQITVPAPTSGQADLTISFGAGDLTLGSGATGLVEGTATYNNAALKPDVVTQGSQVEIKQGDKWSLTGPLGIKNSWDLELGEAPMTMAVNAGAYTGEFELGGLSLTGLTVKDGAATVNLSFSQPNRSPMAVFRYETGASKVTLKGLANANFSTMIFNSGAGDYTLDFGGTLRRDATVTVSTGLSNLIVVVPDSVPATVTVEGGASNVNAGPGWSQNDSVYSQSGSGPALTFLIKTGAGNVTLTH